MSAASDPGSWRRRDAMQRTVRMIAGHVYNAAAEVEDLTAKVPTGKGDQRT